MCINLYLLNSIFVVGPRNLNNAEIQSRLMNQYFAVSAKCPHAPGEYFYQKHGGSLAEDKFN